jgi:hypothetical protein
MYVEVRNPNVLTDPKSGMIFVSDFDDTAVSTTEWHRRSFEAVTQHPELSGLNLDVEKIAELYNLSKMKEPGKAEKEARYTPRLHMLVMSDYIHLLESGEPEKVAWDKTLDRIRTLSLKPSAEFKTMQIDERVFQAMNQIPINAFTHDDYIKEVFSPQGQDNLRIIATRGTMEGPLGQVFKVHDSGVLDNGADMVVYSNDLKSEVLDLLPQFIPWTKGKPMRIFDDNAAEIKEWYNDTVKRKFTNVELALVRHPSSKRRNAQVEGLPIEGRAIGWQLGLPNISAEPIKEVTSRTGETVIDIYRPR